MSGLGRWRWIVFSFSILACSVYIWQSFDLNSTIISTNYNDENEEKKIWQSTNVRYDATARNSATNKQETNQTDIQPFELSIHDLKLNEPRSTQPGKKGIQDVDQGEPRFLRLRNQRITDLNPGEPRFPRPRYQSNKEVNPGEPRFQRPGYRINGKVNPGERRFPRPRYQSNKRVNPGEPRFLRPGYQINGKVMPDESRFLRPGYQSNREVKPGEPRLLVLEPKPDESEPLKPGKPNFQEVEPNEPTFQNSRNLPNQRVSPDEYRLEESRHPDVEGGYSDQPQQPSNPRFQEAKPNEPVLLQSRNTDIQDAKQTETQLQHTDLQSLRSGQRALMSSALRTKVLIVAHMRGGSTFLAELFNRNDEACYWCEPVDPMFHAMYGCNSEILPADVHFSPSGKRRPLTLYERQQLTFHILQLLGEQNPENIAPEILFSGAVLSKPSRWTSHFKSCVRQNAIIRDHRRRTYVSCSEEPCSLLSLCHLNDTETRPSHLSLKSLCSPEKQQCHRNRVTEQLKQHRPCMKHVEECTRKPFRAIKSIRLPLSMAEDVLERDPSVKIIYNIRDPRGIFISRLHGPKWVDSKASRGNRLLDVKLLCQLMDEDYEALRRLQTRFPSNILLMKYEDFAKEPLNYADRVYNFIGRTLPTLLRRWLLLNTNGSTDSGYTQTRRANSTQTAYAWREKITPAQLKYVNEQCRRTLRAYGYPEYVQINRQRTVRRRDGLSHRVPPFVRLGE